MLYNSSISTAKIKKLLNRNSLISEIYYFKEIDSTNLEAKRKAENGDKNASVFIAELQTNGKGRIGRNWISKKYENALFSILIFPKINIDRISQLTPIAGLAICRVLRNNYKLEAYLKWPNDIIIGNNKICGILTESSFEHSRVKYSIVGIGINANTKNFPTEISNKATSILIETNKKVKREQLISAVINEFNKLYSCLESNKYEVILPEYERLCATLGRNIKFKRNNKTISAVADSISNDFSLIAKNNDGIYKINSGEVITQGIY